MSSTYTAFTPPLRLMPGAHLSVRKHLSVAASCQINRQFVSYPPGLPHSLRPCYLRPEESEFLLIPNVLSKKKKKVKWSRYRPGVAQKVGRCIALLFHDRGTRRGWVVSSTPRPRFAPGKDPVPILQEAGWAPGPVWTGGKSHPNRDSIPDRPARSQSLYRLSYRAHECVKCV